MQLNGHLLSTSSLSALCPSIINNPPAIGQGSSGSSAITGFSVTVPAASYVKLNAAQADRLVIELRVNGIIIEGIYDVEHAPDLLNWMSLAYDYPQGVPPPTRTSRPELRFVSQTAISGGPVWQFTERLLRGSTTTVPGFFRVRVIGPQ